MTSRDDKGVNSGDPRVAIDIGALLDGEASEDQRRRAETELFKNADARQLFRGMAADQDAVRLAYAGSDHDDGAERLKAVIEREFALRGARRGASPFLLGRLTGIAASFILVAVTFAATSLWMQSRHEQQMSEVVAHLELERQLLTSVMQDALETRMSGEKVEISDTTGLAEVLTPIATYRSKSGHWCRQYLRQAAYGAHRLAIRGTACRDQSGVWTTVSAEPALDELTPGA